MKKAAIFDLDGTIIKGKSSERRFIEHLIRIGELSPVNIFRATVYSICNIGSYDKMFLYNKYYLKGKPVEKIIHIAEELFQPQINKLIPEEMTRIIQSHKENGELLIIISGTPNFLLDIFTNPFHFDAKKGTELEIKEGKFTGSISGIHPRSERKTIILDEFLNKFNIDLAVSTAYGNHYGDRFILEKTGNPVAVNPNKQLLKYAKSKSWKILKF